MAREHVVVAGVDVGARAVHGVLVEARGDGMTVADHAVFGAADLDALAAWAEGAVAVAVDAPFAGSEGVDHPEVARKFRRARCAEVALGRGAGVWVAWPTPAEGPFAAWIDAGFAVVAALTTGGRPVLETYPHGVFTMLARPARLARKRSAEGRQQRLALLEAAGLGGAAGLRGHDAVDAAACALVARDHADGRAVSFGCDHGGSVMWMPAVARERLPGAVRRRPDAGGSLPRARP